MRGQERDSMATVELQNLSKIYEGGVKAVDNANISVGDKEFLVLVGPSGCGKTTTLRCIAGLEEITDGELSIDGTRMNDVAPKDRDIAMVFQNYALYPHMSVYENMAFGLKIRKYPRSEIETRVRDAAQILDIEELLDRKPKALSGGQRQRVAVGRAIVRKPKVFLFDEPLSNLDAKLRVQMRAEISSLHSRLQATMIYVTHDQVEAMTMGDRIVVMRDGLIQQIGTPLGLYNQPVNRFVAGFIGSPPMNIMNAQVTESNGYLTIDEGDFQIRIDGEMADTLRSHVGKDVLFGIRPEDLLYEEAAAPQNNIKARVEVVEPLGAEIHLYVSTSKTQIIARVPPRHDFQVGEEVNLHPDVTKLHVFDMESEGAVAQPIGVRT
jgi:multiple sugar transport system ATP-binding protein